MRALGRATFAHSSHNHLFIKPFKAFGGHSEYLACNVFFDPIHTMRATITAKKERSHAQQHSFQAR
jgi:hypothetical protein